MNGRLYDPLVGRFLNADNFIQDPTSTQIYNRYSYCLNNPLKYNDPSGELPVWMLWPISWAGNWAIGGLDRWLNGHQTFNQAFSVKNNPVVFSANYSPSTNQFSNSQVDAQTTANLPYEIGTDAFNTVRSEYNMNEWQAASGGDVQMNLRIKIVGAVLTAEDMFNNFGYNHTTYTTLAGEVKDIYKTNGAIRSARALEFATTSTALKYVGNAGTGLMTATSGYYLYNGDINVLNCADFLVGSAGLLNAGALQWTTYGTPVVGEGVALYSWGRLWYDLGANYGPIGAYYGTNKWSGR
jgi:hypothetical protein